MLFIFRYILSLIGDLFVLPSVCMLIWLRDNYSKPTWGLARLHFTYPWFKTLHFAHLYFNPLPTSPSDVKKKKKNPFIKNQNITRIKNTNHWIFSSRALETQKTPFCIWYWNCVASTNLDEQRVIRGTKILVRNQSLFGFLIWAYGCFIVF